ncbi:MAG: hypothetical protein ABSG33_00545 [Candidatus Bathyarchaeia archaeon]
MATPYTITTTAHIIPSLGQPPIFWVEGSNPSPAAAVIDLVLIMSFGLVLGLNFNPTNDDHDDFTPCYLRKKSGLARVSSETPYLSRGLTNVYKSFG